MPHFTARRCFEVPQQRLYASDHTSRIRDMTIYTHYKTIANRRRNKEKKGYGKSKIFMNEYCCLIHAENHEILLNITKGSFLCNSCTDCELKDKWVSFKGKIYEGPYLEFNGKGVDSFGAMRDPGDSNPPDPGKHWTEKGGICCADDIQYYHVDPHKVLFNNDCDLNTYLNYARLYANKKGGEKKRLTFGDDNDDNRNLHLNAKLIGFKYPSKIGFKDINECGVVKGIDGKKHQTYKWKKEIGGNDRCFYCPNDANIRPGEKCSGVNGKVCADCVWQLAPSPNNGDNGGYPIECKKCCRSHS